MAIRRFSTAEPGVKSNKFWDQDTAQGAMELIGYYVAATNSNASFTNIPQTYKDLYIVTTTKDAATTGDHVLKILANGDAGANYNVTRLSVNGTASSSDIQNNTTWGGWTAVTNNATANAGIFSVNKTHILNYSNTSMFKTFIDESAADTNGSGFVYHCGTIWKSTAAINNLIIATTNGGMTAGSTVYLYGIRTVA
jgi:hypothetical protein